MWLTSSIPYLEPRPGSSTDAWTEEARRAGRTGGQRLREVAILQPPGIVAEALRIPSAEKAVVRRRVILLDGKPVELADSWYPMSVAGGTPLAEPNKIKGGAVTLLAALGYTTHHADEDLSVRPATGEEAELLQLQQGSPVISLVRTVSTAEGTTFEVSSMTMNPEGRHLRYHLTVA